MPLPAGPLSTRQISQTGRVRQKGLSQAQLPLPLPCPDSAFPGPSGLMRTLLRQVPRVPEDEHCLLLSQKQGEARHLPGTPGPCPGPGRPRAGPKVQAASQTHHCQPPRGHKHYTTRLSVTQLIPAVLRTTVRLCCSLWYLPSPCNIIGDLSRVDVRP